MATIPVLPAGFLVAGKFRIERLLGAGAFASVYAVRHELTRQPGALKLLHPHVQGNDDAVQRLLVEASAAGRIGSPHVVETLDAGTLDTGEPYVLMELLEGETLRERLRREGALELHAAVELVSQAAEGVEATHRAGIIHRDLKPDNLFITRRRGAPYVKILDFGIAKIVSASLSLRATAAGRVCGTPMYMAPEQWTDRVQVDERADVFSLGAVLFECLTGSLPFEASTPEALLMCVAVGQPSARALNRSRLSPSLREVVCRTLATDRARRYQRAADLVEALRPFRAVRGLLSANALPAATTANAFESSGLCHGSVPTESGCSQPDYTQISLSSRRTHPRPTVDDVQILLLSAALRWRTVRASQRELRHADLAQKLVERSHELLRKQGWSIGEPCSGLVLRENEAEMDTEFHEAWAQIWIDGERSRVERDNGRGQAWVQIQTGVPIAEYGRGWQPEDAVGPPSVTALRPLMLDPARLCALLEFEVIDEAAMCERPAYRVRASVPRLSERGISVLSELGGCGADFYVLLIDRDRGVLLSSIAFVDGTPAVILELVDLAFDEELLSSLFREQAAPSAAPQPIRLTLDAITELAPFSVLRAIDLGSHSNLLWAELRYEQHVGSSGTPRVQLAYGGSLGGNVIQQPVATRDAWSDWQLGAPRRRAGGFRGWPSARAH